MKGEFFIGVLFGIVATTMIVAGVLSFLSHGALLTAIQAAASVAVAASATVAYRAYRSNLTRHAMDDSRDRSEKYLDEAIKLLERAHLIFVPNGAVLPPNDRLLWLTTARFLIRFRHMAERVTEADHIAIAAENEEFYRLKFRATLDASNAHFTIAYFMPSGTPYDATNIARLSIV
ncbi:MAG: hypothetical protein IPM80_15415 [Proteobacteria bacterium]|nr:hypothetical protein [Pseudomonadota bacterium]